MNFPLLEPSGPVALAERTLMLHALELMLIVVVPVFVLAFMIAWHYREANTHAKYRPNREHSKLEELVWWAIPVEIVLVLAALTWSSTHALDPHKALAMSGAPLTVEVVALPWKWLFIYPEQGVASVNQLEIPVNRPIEFDITADAPMNSFWIPALGGQIYAMTGMITTLHLAASTPGEYAGGSANYSGDGFAQMKFETTAMTEVDFDAWVAATKKSPQTLDFATYKELAKPSDEEPTTSYGSVGTNLFQNIVMQFMSPDMAGMHM